MEKIQVFLSSAMNDELKTERAVLRERFVTGSLLSSTFDLYLFEDNAAPNPAKAAYVRAVERSAIVIFVFSETLRRGVVEELMPPRVGRPSSATFAAGRNGRRNSTASSTIA